MTIRNRSFVRVGKFLLAAIVVTVTFAVLGHAVQTVTTPNSATFAYNLAPGGNGANITPAANVPVLILADQTVVGNVGSSLITVVNSAGQDNELVWNGLDSDGGGLVAGFSPVAGTHIAFIDFAHVVDLQVSNATSFHVHNSATSGSTAKGNVTLIW
jgi:hypothetical protein